jgi:hypothetical protein
LATGLMNVAAAALTLGAVAIPLFKKTFEAYACASVGVSIRIRMIGATHG